MQSQLRRLDLRLGQEEGWAAYRGGQGVGSGVGDGIWPLHQGRNVCGSGGVAALRNAVVRHARQAVSLQICRLGSILPGAGCFRRARLLVRCPKLHCLASEGDRSTGMRRCVALSRRCPKMQGPCTTARGTDGCPQVLLEVLVSHLARSSSACGGSRDRAGPNSLSVAAATSTGSLALFRRPVHGGARWRVLGRPLRRHRPYQARSAGSA
mmetsp:Transcript_27300/g.59435  ORF Transcript_27300/g.59435 Transcript_27300/m.59435 type:complete len:210 (-) Transcript_27300:34-663(-)